MTNKCDREKTIDLAMSGENIEGFKAVCRTVPLGGSRLCTLNFRSLNVCDFLLNLAASSGSLSASANINCSARLAYPIFGTIEHFSRQPPGREAAERDMEVLKDLPCQVFRVDGPGTWAIQGDPDRYHWDEADWQVHRIKKLGAKIVMLCGYVPGWIKFDPHEYTKEELNSFLAQYERYLKELVVRYAGEVDYWEIWNEPELFWFDNRIGQKETEVLYRIIRIANRVIRKRDPTAVILTPGFTPDVINCSGPGFALFDSLQRRGMFGLVDALCLHNYPGAYPPARDSVSGSQGFPDWLKGFEGRADLTKIKNYLHQKKIAQPIWFTECGLPYKAGADREAALAFARMLAINAFEGVQVFIQYEAYDYPHDAHPPDFALVHSANGQKSSMFDCYRALIRVLSGAVSAPDAVEYQENQDREMIKCRAFTRNGESILILWNDSLDPKEVQVTFGNSFKKASRISLSAHRKRNFIEQREYDGAPDELPGIRLDPGDFEVMTVVY
ncbi:MAG: hypothetical protein RDU76_10110 [Candidatus Edwardsbacteria bacterium]|nr:hypothetical protein [Candidatus Edwardsbacteria bacterium]